MNTFVVADKLSAEDLVWNIMRGKLQSHPVRNLSFAGTLVLTKIGTIEASGDPIDFCSFCHQAE